MLASGCKLDRPSATSAEQKPCLACHEADRARAKFPDHLATGYPTNCEQCHSQKEWKPAAFDHSGLPLVGGHSKTDCASCHSKEPVPTKCVGCHAEDQKRGPGHTAAGFNTECQSCHTVIAWKPATDVDHSKFPFEGGHANVACISCHPDPSQPSKPIGTTCVACHEKDRSTPKSPDHLKTGFPTTCESCHTIQTWKSATFPHSKLALVGKHRTTACASCHTDPSKPETAKGTTCAECHAGDRPQGATADRPDHFDAALPPCQYCHTAFGWKPAAKDHSKFPLTGQHGGVACSTCHTDPSKPDVPIAKTCVGCHEADRSKPTFPDHRAVGFSTDCDSCHSTNGWKPATFDHGLKFPLTGGHSGVTCAKCHATEPVPKTCVGCHQNDIPSGATASRPDHTASGFSTACSDCHGTGGWKPASFNHTKFPLTQAHAGPVCTDCHTDPQNPSVPTGTTCEQCHLGDRPPAGTNPDHLVGGFPTTCESCHTPTVWKGATFDHSVYLPLTGKHSIVTCTQCHNTTPMPTKCEGCHTPPATNHTATTNCDNCHSVNGWKPAVVDHSKFPLTGKHASTACTQCHTNPSQPSVPTATTCVGCHNSDRSTPTIPNHLANGFPTDCAQCHSTNGWTPASFTHTFPITSGKHKNKPCNNCHLDPNNLKTYSCLGTCHEHSLSKMDDKHKGRSGYISGDFMHCTNSGCHPNGRTP
ncbi:MAG: hypothetical protein KC503_23810 [Myxococcales bacterium]|nr:hypothetical protein [Myxococcales bacterium]